MARVVVLGSGGFGISLAVMLHKYGHQVCMWSKFPQEIESIRRFGENRKLLPGVSVSPQIELTSNIEDGADADLAILAVPSFAVRDTAKAFAAVIRPGTVVANVAKGFEEGTNLRLSQVISEEIPNNPIVVLSGPSHAEEIARDVPTTIVAASASRESAEFVQDILMNTNLRLYVNDDLIGVELGGALKNIIAMCAGICDGMGLGDNAKAALITRGLAEIARLGLAMGADADTFTGLTGMGDLIVTCTSCHSRNRTCGVLIGEGKSVAEAMTEVGATVEGYYAAFSARQLAQKLGVEMPICECAYQMLYEHQPVTSVVEQLMTRNKRREVDETWI